jgi:predicted nucleic acid-binding protein
MTHLLDTSAFTQSRRNLAAANRVDELAQTGRLAVSSIVMLEILFSAQNRREWIRLHKALDVLPQVDLSRPLDAIAVQRRLVDRGEHRTPIVDVMVAATAAEHGLTVLHYDRDFERLTEVTGGNHEWVIPAGTGQKR